MDTWNLHLEGQVQGVGFRPYVYRLAREWQLRGWVNNGRDGVRIVFNAEAARARAFARAVVTGAPVMARITHRQLSATTSQHFDDFSIRTSDASSPAPTKLLLTPDAAICSDCRSELHDPNNRRHDYAFTTCTNCGPRYSIIRALPYDRPATSMADFGLCTHCQSEYDQPDDRRYYSQTNSCPACAVPLRLYNARGELLHTEVEAVLEAVVRAWGAGKLVAIKGIGGYLLTCSARQATAIRELRRRKHRARKPLALMYPRDYPLTGLRLRELEKRALRSSEAPIVLAELADRSQIDLALEEIAPRLDQLGILWPYAPLFELLLQRWGQPIVATSANRSNAPIHYRDADALEALAPLADFILQHDREIRMPQDDSLVRWTARTQQRIVLRRSRGWAPTFLPSDPSWRGEGLLALGGLLKGSFSLRHADQTYVSQYLGDLNHFAAQENYRRTLDHLLELLDAKPRIILVDQHPAYATTQWGKNLAKEWQVPCREVQHHEAHFGAVLGENDLLDTDAAVLGVIWDGTGWGRDGQIWGGEFFTYQRHQMQRQTHWAYRPLLAGDKMAREPRLSALALTHGLLEARSLVRPKFTDQEWNIYATLLGRGSKLQTSSVGRLFDAVASLLGIVEVQDYEGEAAMQVEALARQYFVRHDWRMDSPYLVDYCGEKTIPTRQLLRELIADLRRGRATNWIAAKFHYSLVHLIRVIADRCQIKRLAFSGGVFQNAVLVDLLRLHLDGAYELYFHEQLSPNDENISYGQLVCHQIELRRRNISKLQITSKNTEDHVFSNSRKN
ncbi:MAG: carbamoyltransferase HypF [Bacteroidota bacterium]